jgi:acyl-CoA synthetase (AMP-forming)/AMP-acid ligase II
VVVDSEVPLRLGPIDGVELVTRSVFLAELDGMAPAVDRDGLPDDIAILLFTSGTTGEPKAAVLRHKHLTSYVIGTVDFMSANAEEAALVSVPPYHVAGTSAVLTSVFAGRRVVYLEAFTPESWVALASAERVSQAMVVPTMLGRVLDVLERTGDELPFLRHLSYGGGRMPVPVVERALTMLPHVDFVNAYGLTETSSTVTVLGPEDHRVAIATDDPAVRGRLGSVGRPLPTLEIEIRNDRGEVVTPGTIGELWVRGEQVAGEYLGVKILPSGGWFATNDSAYLDNDGYLYLAGRLDDVIVRGGENISPGEIEDVLLTHPAVIDAAVVGVPDTEWGEKVVAVVVIAEGESASAPELQTWVRDRLRSSRVPQHVVVRPSLPYSELGKLLRRALKSEVIGEFAGSHHID